MNTYDDEDDGPKKIALPHMNIRETNISGENLYQVQLYIFEAFNKFKQEKEVAEYVKKALDENPEMNPSTKGAWHCIVGKTFALSITAETNYFIFVDYPEKLESVLAFRTH